MTQYYGDFEEDATVYIPFNTFSSDDPAASVTVTDLVDADIKVHKDGSTTEITTDGATVAIDFDTVTGNHLITIDTSVDAAYSTGSDYLVRVEGTTVDGATINAWVGSFSIENRQANVAGISTLLTGVDLNDGAITAAKIATDAITSAKIAADAITAAKIATDAISADGLAADAITEIWNQVVESNGSRTAQQVLSIALAILAGQTTSGGATFLDPSGTNTRVAATVNGSNERTAVTLTPSS